MKFWGGVYMSSVARVRGSRWSALLVLAAAGALLVSGVAKSSSAAYSDAEGAAMYLPAAAAVSLSSTAPTTLQYDLATIVPGQTKSIDVTVKSGANIPMRYAISGSLLASSGVNLGSSVSLTVKNSAGTVLNNTAPTVGGITTAKAIVGNPAQGQQAGDRALAAGASEVLTFEIAYPANSTSGAGASTALSLTFAGEQTDNN